MPLGRRDVWRLRPFRLFFSTCGSFCGAATRVARLPCRVSGAQCLQTAAMRPWRGPRAAGIQWQERRRTTEVFRSVVVGTDRSSSVRLSAGPAFLTHRRTGSGNMRRTLGFPPSPSRSQGPARASHMVRRGLVIGGSGVWGKVIGGCVQWG
jgi:hypothetical protein